MTKVLIIFLGLCFFLISCEDKTNSETDKDETQDEKTNLVDIENEVDTDETIDESSDEVADEESDQSDESEVSDENADETPDLVDIEDDQDMDHVDSQDEVDLDQSDESETSDNDIDNGPKVPIAGFGAISGECGFLDTELADAGSHYFKNNIDFATDPYDSEDFQYLTAGGKEIYNDGNLGGSSIYSEMFAFEILNRCEFASLLKTEVEISYMDVSGKKTDFLVDIDGFKIGVSVTRAVKFPFDAEYTVTDAENILKDKLSDILLSNANVASEDSWEKQILHVIAYSDQHAQSLLTAYNSLNDDTKADTIVIITVSDGDDGFLY